MKYVLLSKLMSGELGILRFFPEKERVEFRPGQFVLLKDLETGLFRPYSIASPPEFEYIELFIHFIKGKMTSLLEEADVGKAFDISKGMGKFIYEGESKAVFIGGGAGIAPLLSIMRHIELNNVKGSFKAFLSFRNANMPYLSELKMIRNVDVSITFTRQEVKGFKHGRFAPEDVYLGSDYTYFLCGSKGFVDSFKGYIEEKGGKVKAEGWG